MIERGIHPKMSMQMGELAIVVDGKQVYSHKQAGDRLPSDAELLSRVTQS